MVKDNLTGRAAITSSENIRKIKDMVTEKCIGSMEPFTRETGSSVLSMEKDYSFSQTDNKEKAISITMSTWAPKRSSRNHLPKRTLDNLPTLYKKTKPR